MNSGIRGKPGKLSVLRKFTGHNKRSDDDNSDEDRDDSGMTSARCHVSSVSHIRRCHYCGETSSSRSQRVQRCQACEKVLAPFFFFDDRQHPVIVDNELGLSKGSDNLQIPLLGISFYW